MRANARFVLAAAMACALAPSLAGCGDLGMGGNPNERRAGDHSGGVVVGKGEVAIDPTGDYVVFAARSRLVVGFPGEGSTKLLPVSSPTRVTFGRDRSVVFAASLEDGALDAVDVRSGKLLWSRPIADATAENLRLGVSPVDGRVYAVAGGSVQAFDELDGTEYPHTSLTSTATDLFILADGRALVVGDASSIDGRTITEIRVIYPNSLLSVAVAVPNCVARLAITADEKRAFMAPTFCGSRGTFVSVIDLDPGNERFLRNLPGSGPVAIARNAPRTVAFLDNTRVDPALFDDPSQVPKGDAMSERYSLMLIDSSSLQFQLIPYGEALPRYALTPDGETILVDGDAVWTRTPMIALDARSREYSPFEGPVVQLNDYVMTASSRRAFSLDVGALFDIDISNRTVTPLLMADFRPTSMNISADDKTLFLRDSGRVCTYSIAEHTCTRWLVAPSL